MQMTALVHHVNRIQPYLVGVVLLISMVIGAKENLEDADVESEVNYDTLLPLTDRDIAGFVVAILGLLIASGGGIGGGGILVPTYILVMGFPTKWAVPLSNVTVLGGALANTLFSVTRRHPTADRPLIDWDMILVMEPLTISGAVIGTIVNTFLPSWLLGVLLVSLLGNTAYRTLNKGFAAYRKETHSIAAETYTKIELPTSSRTMSVEKHELESGSPGQSVDGTKLETTGILTGEIKQYGGSDDTESEPAVLENIMEHEKSYLSRFMIIVFVLAGVLIFDLLKGDGDTSVSQLGVVCGSWMYWVISLLSLPWTLGAAFFVRRYLLRITHLKRVTGYKYHPGDTIWDEAATVKYPIYCAVAGLFAGMFGIGGGIVKGPLMLEMGILPQVAAATTATMIVFTSAAACVTYVSFGMLRYDYGIPMFCLGFFTTLIGQCGLNMIMKKNKRPSLIILSIGFVVAISTVLMGTRIFIKAFEDAGVSETTDICPVSDALSAF
eukprot:CAMPEP_0185769210 /NCGR_PEP_ID=MMETSP1174-20130828/53437_1 /TAXON_ID=35687 /ORGANISM="Dictyocha speculum, Strain CCMP1381" /LENGTH=495 /DNA_ID=CAMNT_0028454193 /DNA_START=17 /DNA_END=1504 /DNA_ORIENTATION=+